MTKKNSFFIILLGSLSLVACTRAVEEFPYDANYEIKSGGSQTVIDAGRGAFGHIFPNISSSNAFEHEVGDKEFGATFVSAPALLNPGLGPVYNNVSCISCHVNDGRGVPTQTNGLLSSLLFRLSIPSGNDGNEAPQAIPMFGGQLQDKSIFGFPAEGKVTINYQEQVVQLLDEVATVRVPTYTISNTYKELPSGYRFSPRMAPPVFGLGLLEAIDDATLKSFEDVNDANNDGISGKANYVLNGRTNTYMIGKFGWKAEAPTVEHQVAGAYVEDMGITSPVFHQESSHGQFTLPFVNNTDINDSILRSVTRYVQTLAVPARRNLTDPSVIKGKALFAKLKCSGCHIPAITTGVNVAFAEVSNQRIFPYTDLLLHDMGNELGDNRPTYKANGNEWRTAPLWGIGLTQAVNGHTFFMHDGRARSLTEAILWHGGEGAKSKEGFTKLSKAERQDLLNFLGSL